MENLEDLRKEVFSALQGAGDLRALEEVRVRYLGKKGAIKSLQKGLGSLTPEERPKVGAQVNQLHDEVESALESKRDALESSALEERLKKEQIDISLPGREDRPGTPHPISILIDEISTIFARMGYDIYAHREIETDYYNFEALNFPADHPARDMQDTFFVGEGLLLRSHTSNAQIHYMEHQKPPFKMITPGRCYRCDTQDATHLPLFHQVEGLVVAKDISMAHLKWTLETFLRELFGPKTEIRMRPSFFPFTEPSAEVDVWFEGKDGEGKWLEMLGAGLVDPNVLLACQIDPEEWSGFAFGVGVERLAMVRYGIKDIRMFYENDVRVLRQFEGQRQSWRR
ncbi:MAG: phenylalanine--tRNA ligase subunit alpha [Candidatus Omnitrophica bacterium]|nr:phenylalanine--tRNA ligase subunit alpha [Candidatus Omnitrophota bacterium]